MGDKDSSMYISNLKNTKRLPATGGYYHAHPAEPESPRKLLSEIELKEILDKEPLEVKDVKEVCSE